MDKSQPPAYTPAEVYQPEQTGAQLYPPIPQPHPYPQPQPQPYPYSQPQPAPQPQQPAVIIHTTGPGVAVGSGPTRVTCPSCRAEIVTSVKHTSNCKTHAFAFVLCLFICWPCVCIPYCMDSCQTANHYCPNCDAFIGQHEN